MSPGALGDLDRIAASIRERSRTATFERPGLIASGETRRLAASVAIPYGICEFKCMTVRMDKAGRVTLPKAVRDRLGLQAGSDLEMVATEDGLVLKPASTRASMVRRDGLWVHAGKLPAGFDPAQAVRDDREERIRKLAGL